jgi:heat shock protein HslJ
MKGVRWMLGLSALGLSTCAADPPAAGPAAAPPPSLVGTRWVGVVDDATDPRHRPRLEFTPGRMSGFTGCNMMSGAWSAEGGEVRLGPMMATKRFCVGPEMDIEKRVLAAMGEKARVTREGERLVFASEGGRFEFRPAPPGE